jgi:hypothetical protein
VPLLGESSPASRPSSVDLPEPDAPTIATASPARSQTRHLRGCAAARRRRRHVRHRRLTSTTGAGGAGRVRWVHSAWRCGVLGAIGSAR